MKRYYAGVAADQKPATEQSPTSRPVLFLDYDGVLHPDAVYRTSQGIVLRRQGLRLFEWAPLLEAALAPHPEVRIVLSTSWVRVVDFDHSRQRLPPGLQTRVIGATWHSQMDEFEWETLSRFNQVMRYVVRHRLQRWLAIDDDAEGWPTHYRMQLVLTDSELGLSADKTIRELAEKLARLASGRSIDVSGVKP